MLMPSRTKHRKVRKGRIHGGTASALSTIAYGRFGLVSLESQRIDARQIEAARQAMTRYIKRGGRGGRVYAADLVTEMTLVKHPFRAGIKAGDLIADAATARHWQQEGAVLTGAYEVGMAHACVKRSTPAPCAIGL